MTPPTTATARVATGRAPNPTTPKEHPMARQPRTPDPKTQQFLEQSSERLCDAADQIKAGHVITGGKAFVRELLRQPE